MPVRTMVALLLVVMLGGCAQGEGKDLRILAVGNSFSSNALRDFGDIVTASGNRLVAVNACINGCDFEGHVRRANAAEANPNDPAGRPYPGNTSLKELLTQQRWDFVTIQQSSPKSFMPETYHPHADQLIAYIRKYAPQAEIVLFETWAYRADHGFWGVANLNADSMYRKVRAAYDGLAKDAGLRVIPCGDAMEMARRDPDWGPFEPDPAFDPKTAVYPALPGNERHALNIGYGWMKDPKTGADVLGRDGTHANAQGEYLLGCVWFEFFFGQTVVGNTCVPQSVGKENAVILQRIAHRVVSEHQRPEPKP